MSNRLFVAALAAVLVAAGVWYFVVIKGVGRTPSLPVAPVVDVVPEPSPIQPAPPEDNGTVEPPAAVDDTQRQLQVLAMTFAERYGTYSTDAAFANLKRLMPLVTSSYAATLEATIQRGIMPGAGGYYGVTTRALSAVVEESGDSSATVKVATQRQESFNRGGEASLSYQSIIVTLVRANEQWLVADARWEK